MKLIKCRKCERHFRVTDNDYCLSKCTGCGSTDLEETIYKLDGSSIDWAQRRYEIAKSAMQGILGNSHESDYRCGYKGSVKFPPKGVAEWAIEYADALIEELKGK